MFPPWHAVGSQIMGVIPAAFGEGVSVWGPNNRIPSAKDIIDIIEFARCDEACIAAPMYQDIIDYENGLAVLKKLKAFWYGGGKLAWNI